MSSFLLGPIRPRTAGEGGGGKMAARERVKRKVESQQNYSYLHAENLIFNKVEIFEHHAKLRGGPN
jgi:hypothetical protein